MKIHRMSRPSISASLNPSMSFGPRVPGRHHTLQIEREDGIVRGLLDDDAEAFAAVAEIDTGSPAFGDVLGGQQDEFRLLVRPPDLAAVQDHPPSADALEDVVHLEVAERALLGEDLFQERSKSGDIPLPVAEFVDETALSHFAGDTESFVERAIG